MSIAIIIVDDASRFRPGRKVSLGLGRTVFDVVDVTKTTISVTTPEGAAPSFNLNDGAILYSIDWPDKQDIDTDSPGKRLCTYAKVTRHPQGTPEDNNPHTELRLISLITATISSAAESEMVREYRDSIEFSIISELATRHTVNVRMT